MGKKMFVALVVAVVAMFAGYNIYASQETNVLSDLVVANIEALAWDEDPNSNGNAGPSELFDCPFWFTGDGIHCICANSSPCTTVLCD